MLGIYLPDLPACTCTSLSPIFTADDTDPRLSGQPQLALPFRHLHQSLQTLQALRHDRPGDHDVLAERHCHRHQMRRRIGLHLAKGLADLQRLMR